MYKKNRHTFFASIFKEIKEIKAEIMMKTYRKTLDYMEEYIKK